VDGSTLELHTGQASDVQVARLYNGDYGVGWTARESEPAGVLMTQRIARFGTALLASPGQFAAQEQPASGPLVLATGGDSLGLAYQDGSGISLLGLAETEGPEAETLRSLLAQADQGDLAVTATTRGLWFVWSERFVDSRRLHTYLLPVRDSALQSGRF